jgi:hypothetical protein
MDIQQHKQLPFINSFKYSYNMKQSTQANLRYVIERNGNNGLYLCELWQGIGNSFVPVYDTFDHARIFATKSHAEITRDLYCKSATIKEIIR